MTRRTVGIAVALVVLLTPAVTATSLGDLSCDCPERARPLDTMFDAPELNDSITALAGVVAVAATLGALFVIAVALRREVAVRDLRIAIPLVLGGVYAGLTYRVVTAGVVGANIGGGVLLLATPLVTIVVIVWAVLWRPRGHRQASSSTPTTRT